MYNLNRKGIVFGVLFFIIIAWTAPASAQVSHEGDGAAMVADLVVVRPLSLAATAIGCVAFVASGEHLSAAVIVYKTHDRLNLIPRADADLSCGLDGIRFKGDAIDAPDHLLFAGALVQCPAHCGRRLFRRHHNGIALPSQFPFHDVVAIKAECDHRGCKVVANGLRHSYYRNTVPTVLTFILSSCKSPPPEL